MARTGKFKCSACGRSFGMAAHLGRHMTTIHGAKAAKAKAKSRVQAGDPARLLNNVRAWRSELAAEQAQLATQLGALDQLLTTLGGTAPKPTAGRALQGRRIGGGHGGAREGSLKSYIDRVLRATRRPMRRAEVTAAVLKAGYQSRSKTLAKSVGVALRTMSGVKKIGRGVFRAV
jgi:hypothetical protein